MSRYLTLLAFSLVLLLVVTGCGNKDNEVTADNTDNNGNDDVAEMTQVGRGAEVFNTICIKCHKPEGGGEGPKLDRKTLAAYKKGSKLYRQVSKFMPDNDPGSLEDQQYYDVVAYLLENTGFVEEAPEINAETLDDLEAIELTRE